MTDCWIPPADPQTSGGPINRPIFEEERMSKAKRPAAKSKSKSAPRSEKKALSDAELAKVAGGRKKAAPAVPAAPAPMM